MNYNELIREMYREQLDYNKTDLNRNMAYDLKWLQSYAESHNVPALYEIYKNNNFLKALKPRFVPTGDRYGKRTMKIAPVLQPSEAELVNYGKFSVCNACNKVKDNTKFTMDFYKRVRHHCISCSSEIEKVDCTYAIYVNKTYAILRAKPRTNNSDYKKKAFAEWCDDNGIRKLYSLWVSKNHTKPYQIKYSGAEHHDLTKLSATTPAIELGKTLDDSDMVSISAGKACYCTQCEQVKPKDKFRIKGLSGKCISCIRDHTRTKEGHVAGMYLAHKARARAANVALPNYTKEQLNEWLHLNGYSDLYLAWVLDDYNKRNAPTVVLDNTSLGHNLDNMTLMGYADSVKARGRKVNKYDNETLIKTYQSVTSAAQDHGMSYSNIRNACTGAQKSAGGYFWRYADTV